MNEARVVNFALIGMFIIMLFTYVFAVQYINNVNKTEITTVSAFCG